MSDQQYTFVGTPGNCNENNSNVYNLPNTTANRICGFPYPVNATDLSPCCSGSVQNYFCNSYCATDMSILQFESCYFNSTGTNSSTQLSAGRIYCQGNITGTTEESLKTSFATPRARPTSSHVLLALLVGLLLVSPSLASVVHSLDNGVTRRATDTSACTFDIDQTFTTIGRQLTESARYDGTNIESVGVNIDVSGNNRTLNGTSAPDAKYDAFFDVVANLTSRRYPAMTGMSMYFEWITGGSTTYLTFTPYLVSDTCRLIFL